ncbi:MAG TPA: T9SS type A sorting domain-containing protein [Chitinispirillaceae bacterium]|nr:T9SS type A sorting domain-containing protein [Chitinispirillaceae bacterium]
MNKYDIFSLSFAAVTALMLSHPISAQQKCQNLDAITTASLELTNQSKICETTADFYFTYNETNGSRIFSYGTTTEYGSNGGDIAGNSRSKTINLTGLQPDTKYYFKVVGEYKTRTRYTMTGTFTTQTSGSAVFNDQTDSRQITLISIGNNSISVPQSNDKVLTVELYSIDGKQIMKHKLTVGSLSAFVPLQLTNGTGTYLCRITGPHTTFSQKVVLSK